jgi:hypothetical protein
MSHEELAQLLRAHFATTTDLNLFLQMHIWPHMPRKVSARPPGRPARYINARFVDLDGSPLPDREVDRRAKDGRPVREAATGRTMRYKHYNRFGGVWEEIT